MWRLVLSGLLCFPAAVLLIVGQEENFGAKPHAVISQAAGIVTPSTAVPTLHLRLPPVQLSARPELPDTDSWGVAGLVVTIPPQQPASQSPPVVALVAKSRVPLRARTNVAMGHHVSQHFVPRASGSEIASIAGPPARSPGTLMAFFARNLTRRAFALPDQNGGG